MTDYKSMFEQAVRTLAAIDEALGIGDDGCGDNVVNMTRPASDPINDDDEYDTPTVSNEPIAETL